MDMTRPFGWCQCIEVFRDVLSSGVSRLRAVLRYFSFPGDSVFLLAALLLANYLRIYFPGLITDSLFGIVVLLLGITLFRDGIPATARSTLFCFAALLGIYAVGLMTEFSFQGVRHFAGILLAGIIYLFCYRNGPALARSKHVIFLLLIAMLALFPLYLVPASLNPHVFSDILGYLLLTVGFILVVRSENRKVQHRWVHVILILVVVNGIVFGDRSLVLVALLAYLLYGGGYLFLRGRAGAGTLAVITGSLIFFMTAFLSSSHFNSILSDLDSFAQEYMGGRILTGREAIWRETLINISEAPWFGKGPGVVIASVIKSGDSSLVFQQSILESSCAEGGPGLVADCATLLDARDTLVGNSSAPFRLRWSPIRPISSWRGVKVDGVPPRVTGLDLRGMGLAGRIPPELGGLDKLSVLRLSGHKLSGSIPPELGGLGELRQLVLAGNTLTGSIPPELGRLLNLEELWLGDNALSGPIPPELGGLDKLSVLRFSGNEFSGSTPPALYEVDDHDFVIFLQKIRDARHRFRALQETELRDFGTAIKKINAFVDPPDPREIPKSSHNLFLQIGLQMGVVGIIALGLLCVSLIFNLRARKGEGVGPVRCFAAACTLMVILHNTFDVLLLQNLFSTAVIAWILIGVGAGVVNHGQGSASGTRVVAA